jgi:hypothetical protein
MSSDELQALIICRLFAFSGVPLSQIFATEIYQVVQDLVCHLHSNNQLAMNECMQGYVEHLYKVWKQETSESVTYTQGKKIALQQK